MQPKQKSKSLVGAGWLLTAFFVLLSLGLAREADAQVQSVVPPVFNAVDAQGVDGITGRYRLRTTEVVIGQPGSGGLVHSRSWIDTGWRDDLAGTINASGSVYTVSLGGRSETFTLSGGVYSSNQHLGSTLEFNTPSTNFWKYTTADGTVAYFYAPYSTAYTNFWQATSGTISSLVKPDGEVIIWNYSASSTIGGVTGIRPQSITNNFGYQIHFTYQIDSPTSSAEITGGFLTRTKVTGINRAYLYCAETAFTCNDSSGGNWPYVTYGTESSGAVQTVTDRLSHTTRYAISGSDLTAVRKPSVSSGGNDSIGITYSGGYVSQVAFNYYNTWSYSVTDTSGTRSVAVGDVGNAVHSVTKSDIAAGWTTELWEDTSGSRKSVLTRDSYGHITRLTSADSHYVEFTYDSRGNITQTVRAPKSGSGLSNITTSAHFPSCTGSNQNICNKPDYAIDERGHQTDFTYDTNSGGVASVTLPAPSSTLTTRPQTRFTYTALYAWYKNSSGTLVPDTYPVYRLTASSACATGSVASSCVGTSDETRAVLDYQAGSSSTPSNLLLATTTARSGNSSGTGALSSSTALTYTVQGDVASVNGPLSGSADTNYFYYDDVRRLLASVSPDPDNTSGGLDPRVTRFTYDADGLPTLVELGYVSTPSSWASATILQKVQNGYDPNGLLVSTRLQGWYSGTSSFIDASLTQFQYDTVFRPLCVAQRMNPYAFDTDVSAVPACNQGTSIYYGPDRIRSFGLNGYDETTQDVSGYGTSAQRTDVARTFATTGSFAGLLTAETDAGVHKTSYEYDGFNRLTKTSFPDPTTSYTSSTTDYRVLGYNATGQLESRLDRGESSAAQFLYDNNGLLTNFDGVGTENDTGYTHDNFGRVTQITLTGGATLTYTYDALGRLTSEQQGSRTVSYEYDAAGNRTKMTWPDGTYIRYTYDTVGELLGIYENASSSYLVYFGYDNLGRRGYIYRGNGGFESWVYDWGNRLWGFGRDLVTDGSTHDLWTAFNLSPAAQHVNRSTSTDDYKYTLPAAFTDDYTSNGLNQYTSVTSVSSLSYDARGNLITAGAYTYGYDKLNQLTSVTGSGSPVLLHYDAVGRLASVCVPGSQTCSTGSPPNVTNTYFLYDGPNLIAEYDDSGTITKRYVHGLGPDEPLIAFVGSSYSSPHNLYSDEHGSIVAEESSSSVQINKYDEYGRSASINAGRFQFTGQMWIGEAGIYLFKARAYSPKLGRFMQTDPIGYAGGRNLYAYVGNDPFNLRDPTGLGPDDPPPIVIKGNRYQDGSIGSFVVLPSLSFDLDAHPETLALLKAAGLDAVVATNCEGRCPANRRSDAAAAKFFSFFGGVAVGSASGGMVAYGLAGEAAFGGTFASVAASHVEAPTIAAIEALPTVPYELMTDQLRDVVEIVGANDPYANNPHALLDALEGTPVPRTLGQKIINIIRGLLNAAFPGIE